MGGGKITRDLRISSASLSSNSKHLKWYLAQLLVPGRRQLHTRLCIPFFTFRAQDHGRSIVWLSAGAVQFAPLTRCLCLRLGICAHSIDFSCVLLFDAVVLQRGSLSRSAERTSRHGRLKHPSVGNFRAVHDDLWCVGKRRGRLLNESLALASSLTRS